MRPARRLDSLPVYAFASLGARLQALQANGVDIIRLDIGSPDGPPTERVMDALAASVHDPTRHGYPGFMGLPALRQAMADYYQRRFGVTLNPTREILPLIGSKEGIANMSLAWLDAGDLALVPDPGYPTYRMGAALAGADVCFMPLFEENEFLPDLVAIPPEAAERARIMWLNYPRRR
jgi:LL-diaminopimelate aminotransferase